MVSISDYLTQVCYGGMTLLEQVGQDVILTKGLERGEIQHSTDLAMTLKILVSQATVTAHSMGCGFDFQVDLIPIVSLRMVLNQSCFSKYLAAFLL